MGKDQHQKNEDSSDFKVIATNRKARFDYHIEEVYEAGLVLSGNEIKSIRSGAINLKESYIKPRGLELYLVGAHITEYAFSSAKDYDPVRPRKLLMHRKEIHKLRGRVEAKGYTIVPLRVYLKRGLAKLEVGLARGKAAPDKRRTIMAREKDREAERAMRRG